MNYGLDILSLGMYYISADGLLTFILSTAIDVPLRSEQSALMPALPTGTLLLPDDRDATGQSDDCRRAS